MDARTIDKLITKGKGSYADRRKAFAKALAAAMRVSEKTGFGATLLGLPASKGSR